MVETTDNGIVASGFFGRLKPPPRSLAPLRRKPLAGLTAPTPEVLSGVLAAHAAELRAEAGGGRGSGGDEGEEAAADEAEADVALRESMQALSAATAGLPELPELTVRALDAVRLQGSSGRTWVLRVLRLYEARVRTLEGELAISARERATVSSLQQTLAQERQRASALRAVCRALLPLQVGADAAAASERRSKEAAKHAEALATIVRQAEGLRKEKAAAAARAAAAEGEVAAAKAAAAESERCAKAAAAAAAPVQRERDELQRAKRQLEGRLETLAEEAAQLRLHVDEVRLEGAAAADKARAAGEAAAAKGAAEKAQRAVQEAAAAAAAAAARSAEQAMQADAAEMAKLRGAVAAAEGEVELQGEAWRAEAQACLGLLLPHCSHPSVLQGEVNAAVQRAIVDVTQALAAAKSSLEASQNVVRMLKDMADMHREEIAHLSAAHGNAVEKLKAEFAASRRPPSEPPPRIQSPDRVDRACSPVAHLSEVVMVVASSRPAPTSKVAAAAAGPKVSQRVQAAVERMQNRQNEREKKWREKKNRLREERASRKQGVLASVGHFETGDDDGADVSDGGGSDEGGEYEEGSSSSQHSEEDGRQKLREILARLQGEPVRPERLPQAEDVLAERKRAQPGAAGDLPISMSFTRGGGGGGFTPEAAEPKQSRLADLAQKLRGGGV